MKQIVYIVFLTVLIGCGEKNKTVQVTETAATAKAGWEIDFLDEFDTFNPDNWQDQRIWVNNEKQCYVPDGEFGTREVSDGSLKLKVVNVGELQTCDNLDKHGVQHPETQYMAGRICSKNRKEFIKGKWTARLRLQGKSEASMFPAWWILGARNNESPVQEADEDICWPLTGSGEIDIFEHHGDAKDDHFTTGAIKSEGECDKGDWWSYRKDFPVTLSEYHEYSVEWEGSDLVYRVDGEERNVTWSPDDSHLLSYVWARQRRSRGLYTMPADGTGSPEQLLKTDFPWVPDWKRNAP